MQFDELLYETVTIQNLKSKISQLEQENEKLKQNISDEDFFNYRKILEKYDYKLISCKHHDQKYIFTILDLKDSRDEYYANTYAKNGLKPTADELVCSITCLTRQIPIKNWT